MSRFAIVAMALAFAGCAHFRAVAERYYVVEAGEALRLAESADSIIDLRPPADYETGHIPSAQSIPLNQLWFRMYDVPSNHDALILAYDDDPSRQARAGEMLKAEGYYRVHFIRGGFEAWRSVGGVVSVLPAPPRVYRNENLW